MEEYLEMLNPDEEFEVEDYKPRKRRKTPAKATFQPSGLTTVFLVGTLVYLLVCAYARSKTGNWTWTPWTVLKALSQRRLQAEAESRQNSPEVKQVGYQVVSYSTDPSKETVGTIGV